MKKFVFLILLIAPLKASEQETLFNQSITLKDVTYKIHRRYYYVERLKKTMKLIERINEKLLKLDFLIFRHLPEFNFTHHRIQQSMNEIIKTKSLKPLFMVWDDFALYKSLEDEIFVEEFTKEVFIITKSTLIYGLSKNESPIDKIILKTNLATMSSLETLEYIDLMTNYLIHNGKTGLNELLLFQSKNIKGDILDISAIIQSEDILLRFYYIERLKNIIKTLKKYDQKSFLNQSKNPIAEINFTNSYVSLVGKKISEKKSLDPLFLLWDGFKGFKYLNNLEYRRESLILLFVVLKNGFLNVLKDKKLRSNDIDITAQQIIELYKKIESLPIEEILQAIDLVTSGIKVLLESKEPTMQSSWGSLMTQYWWIKPLIAVGIILKVVNHYMPIAS